MSIDRVVLITGAAGFIGAHTADHFSKAGWEVIGVDRNRCRLSAPPGEPYFNQYITEDIANDGNIIAYLNRHRPRVCIHLAGPANVGASFHEPYADFSAHTLPLLRLLEAVRLSEAPPRVLLVSSAAVYGNPDSLPVTEEARIKPISPYGFHKYYQEMLLDQYRALYGLAVCKARVFSTYGPGLTHLAVWDITHRALLGDYVVFGNGKESRDYLYVKDVAAALYHIARRATFSGEAINVASGRETLITELAGKIYRELGIAATARPLKRQSGMGAPIRWCADVSRLRRLGFMPGTSLEEGISTTVEWIGAECTASAL